MESSQQDPSSIIGTLNTEKHERCNWTEPQSNNNRNTTHPNLTEQRLREKTWILRLYVKRCLRYHRKKRRLGNSQSRICRNKQIISTNLNERLYGIKLTNMAGGKLICEKIGVPSRTKNLKGRLYWKHR